MNERLEINEIHAAADELAGRLTTMKAPAGHWTGELSSSALSTATAAMALHAAGSPAGEADRRLIEVGLKWLAANCNTDGGWGDTTASQSNISTTLLVWAVLSAAGGGGPDWRKAIDAVEKWIVSRTGGLDPARIAKTLKDCYGRDKTFAVPILTMLAMAGVLGESPRCWDFVPALPFELAMLPRKLFRFLRLGVVSYALPALIAIGQVREKFQPAGCPVKRAIRRMAAGPTLKLLEKIQPAGGGFLEATPLTSFVAMSLAAMGLGDCVIAKRSLEFIRRSVRADGSWPIDTDLSVWVTTLATNAIELAADDNATPLDWLLERQQANEHPYTLSPPGGWGWSDKSGAVPDADDTAGALLAISRLARPDDGRAGAAAAKGLDWLAGLQNADGGIPTFCRGWGALPFDRSSPDLTAHGLAAMSAWVGRLESGFAESTHKRLTDAMRRMINYLESSQRPDGSWLALWFGNELAKDQANPVYCTARVVSSLCSAITSKNPAGDSQKILRVLNQALRWLMAAQNSDGGWGGDAGVRSSIEETALAVWALADAAVVYADTADVDSEELRQAALRGAGWLVDVVRRDNTLDASPIGLYFARLWYSEKLYPLIFAAGALRRAARLC